MWKVYAWLYVWLKEWMKLYEDVSENKCMGVYKWSFGYSNKWVFECLNVHINVRMCEWMNDSWCVKFVKFVVKIIP